MTTSIKKTLDNPHSTNVDVTQKDIFDTIEGLQENEFVKIVYRKITKPRDKRRIINDMVTKINELKVADLSTKTFKVLDNIISNYHGEEAVGYYKRPTKADLKSSSIRNASGYVLFQDENDEWKSVEVKNVLNLTTIDGVKLVRNVG